MLESVKICPDFEKWQQRKGEFVYYVHTRDLISISFADVFAKKSISYHGKTRRFSKRYDGHVSFQTINAKMEDMFPVFISDKQEDIALLEALGLVIFKEEGEIKNGNLELEPILNRKKDDIERGLRTLLHGLISLYEYKANKLPAGQLRKNCENYVKKLQREIEERLKIIENMK